MFFDRLFQRHFENASLQISWTAMQPTMYFKSHFQNCLSGNINGLYAVTLCKITYVFHDKENKISPKLMQQNLVKVRKQKSWDHGQINKTANGWIKKTRCAKS